MAERADCRDSNFFPDTRGRAFGAIGAAAKDIRFGAALLALALALSAGVEAARAESAAAAPITSGTAKLGGLWNPEEATGNRWGLRPELAGAGISIGAQWMLEGFGNFRGGKHTGLTGASTFDLNCEVETAELLGLTGGLFRIDLEDHAGRDPSRALVGDIQVFDKPNFRSYVSIFELWYQQELFDGMLRVKIGKVDGNTEFAVVTNGLDFLSSSAQLTPTLSELPTTPAPMASVNIFYRPNRLLYTSFGLYDASRGDDYLNFTGKPENAQKTSGGVLLIGEAGLNWDRMPELRSNGDLRLGVWEHTGKFEEFDADTHYGTEGFYLILDQTLWQPALRGHRRGLRAFLEYGHTEESVASIYQHVGGGLAWTGPFANRPEDVMDSAPSRPCLAPKAISRVATSWR